MKTLKQFILENTSSVGITVNDKGQHFLHGVPVAVKRAEPKPGMLSRIFSSKPKPTRSDEMERRIKVHGEASDIQTPFHDVVGMRSDPHVNHARKAVKDYGISSYSLNSSLHRGEPLSAEDQYTHQGLQKAIEMSGPTRKAGIVFSGQSRFLSSAPSIKSKTITMPAYTSLSPDRSVAERFAINSTQRADRDSAADPASHPHYLHFEGQPHKNVALHQQDVHHFINGTASPELHKKYGIKPSDRVQARPFVNMIHASLPKGSRAVNFSRPGEEIAGGGEHEAELVVGPGSKFHRKSITMDLAKGTLIHHGVIET